MPVPSHRVWAYHARMRLCFIGDSYVTGTGDETCQGWAGRLCACERQAGHDLTLYNLGVRGQTSHDIALRWQAEAQARLHGRDDGGIILSFGANDARIDAAGQPRLALQDSLHATEQILRSTRAAWPTLMIGPPPVGRPGPDQRTRVLEQAMAALCSRAGVPFLSVWAPLLGSAAWCGGIAQGDGLHPGGAGHAVLARLVHDWPAWRDLIAGAKRTSPFPLAGTGIMAT
ncbi:GDSL-type esterase/lipase family protein [Komagataeibacter xylinus]|nr:GDSL-type esterase/lipase family protein [Komagataeibacter xylinus]GBQ71386.1 lipolytic protein G-D-S-L [Komagataeibacter xylinus NBRC 15237]